MRSTGLPAFPRTERDLEDWRVLADELLERGEDTLGRLLAHELAADEPGDLHALQELVRRACVAHGFEVGWCLGHARTIGVRRLKGVRGKSADYTPPDVMLHRLDEFLGRPRAQLVEKLTVPANAHSFGKNWRAAMRMLPRSCTAIEVDLHWKRGTEDCAERLLESLPEHVRMLSLGAHAHHRVTRFIDDRLSILDLRKVPLDPVHIESVLARLSDTRRVRVRLGHVLDRRALASHPRIEFGDIDDAALLNERSVTVFRRPALVEMQKRHGYITARAQLLRAIPEPYGIVSHRPAPIVWPWHGGEFVRQRSGQWTLRPPNREQANRDSGTPEVGDRGLLQFELEGVPLGEGQIVPLPNGSRLTIAGVEWRFIASDVDAACRSM